MVAFSPVPQTRCCWTVLRHLCLFFFLL